MNKAEILKAIKSGEPIAYGQRSYSTPRKVRILGAGKVKVYRYGALRPERDWKPGWTVQHLDAIRGFKNEIVSAVGDEEVVESRELLGPWDAIQAKRQAEQDRSQAESARRDAEYQRQEDAARKIRKLFEAVGAGDAGGMWGNELRLKPTHLYEFLEALGKTTVRALAADARQRFASETAPGAADGYDFGYATGATAVIDYIEEKIA